jgi:hypothetical protein
MDDLAEMIANGNPTTRTRTIDISCQNTMFTTISFLDLLNSHKTLLSGRALI